VRLRKRNGVYHVRYWLNGVRVERSTKLSDKKAAEALARQWERDAADPDHENARRATLNEALTLLLREREEEAKARRKSEGTVAFYREKAGHWARVLGHDFPLAQVSVRVVRDYISRRRAEPARATKKRPAPTKRNPNPPEPPPPPRVSDHTIGKELVALRAALKLAKERGLWKGDPKAVIPVSWGPKYKPKRRWLPEPELDALFRALAPDEAARVAFMVATSAELSATDRAQRADVYPDRSRVLVRGTKRDTRLRVVPIVTEWQRSLVKFALDHAEGSGGKLFAPWPNLHQSLRWACKRAGIERCSPNDLRRTFAQWMRRDGLPLELIAPMMGHKTTTMLQLVYGTFDEDSLDARVRAVLCPTGAPVGGAKAAIPATSAAAEEASSPQESSGEVSGPSGTRTQDQRIKSPSRLWPSPGKKPRAPRLRKSAAPPVPHGAERQTASGSPLPAPAKRGAP
jgi:integrase